MKVTYIEHSGVSVELADSVLLFDYYRGELPSFSQDKTLYVFASHRHPDHYTADIFRLAKQYSRIHYILSHDISFHHKSSPMELMGKELYQGGQVVFADAHKQFVVEQALVETLHSTDTGVAYLVEIEDKIIYHAGDLNWWHWNGESKAYNRNMEVNYKREIDRMAAILCKQKVDLSFLPLDPRLEDNFAQGMSYYMQTIPFLKIMPIHMWGQYEWIDRYRDILPEKLRAAVLKITCEGDTFML
ncbi:MAG: MBL fold metallo-hydrolase [Lachnospiraceae bacterium]